jgi:type I restriction-modification system DNA methylase subunit
MDVRALNEAVQVFLDRLIFIRIAEDRRIVEAESLRRLVEQWSQGKHRSLRAMLNRLFEEINDDLNGEVFKPNAALDAAAFDDALVAKIVHGLYDGPYDFAVIGVELLGSIYERYLGKTIRVTAKRAIVEDKPEVRKAGGVYYTPRYIVDYIVEQTVGKLVEGKTPAQIAKMRILDPACGSGSFLLAAYQKLIDHHVAFYSEHPTEARQGELFPYLIQEPDGRKRLSIEKKGEILTNNIFGVDIDPQAVEITMMSLYIKALEGETTLPHKHGLLPTLANNIKCGNSLIGPDYFEGQLMVDAEEWERVKPFDWESQFAPSPALHRRAGEGVGGVQFDCVIGNPPYGALIGETEAQYLRAKFETTNKDLDTYSLFMEQAVRLCKPRGAISMIVPTGWYSGVKFSSLRRFIACTTDPESFVNLPYDIFGAWVDTSVCCHKTASPYQLAKDSHLHSKATNFSKASSHCLSGRV